MSNRYKIVLSYDGTRYGGWQVQPNSTSIQSLVQHAIETVLRESIQLTGATRTDSGVHALYQAAHFDTVQTLNPPSFLRSINALLPFDIRALELKVVDASFHARYSAQGKIYRYYIQRSAVSDPFFYPFRWHFPYPLNIEEMKKGAFFLTGTKDFKAFANDSYQGAASRDSVRTIHSIQLIEEDGVLILEFFGDGFLYKMVRNIVGTLIEVGKGKLLPEDLLKILESKDRKKAGQAAPAHGLFLHKIIYR